MTGCKDQQVARERERKQERGGTELVVHKDLADVQVDDVGGFGLEELFGLHIQKAKRKKEREKNQGHGHKQDRETTRGENCTCCWNEGRKEDRHREKRGTMRAKEKKEFPVEKEALRHRGGEK